METRKLPKEKKSEIWKFGLIIHILFVFVVLFQKFQIMIYDVLSMLQVFLINNIISEEQIENVSIGMKENKKTPLFSDIYKMPYSRFQISFSHIRQPKCDSTNI